MRAVTTNTHFELGRLSNIKLPGRLVTIQKAVDFQRLQILRSCSKPIIEELREVMSIYQSPFRVIHICYDNTTARIWLTWRARAYNKKYTKDKLFRGTAANSPCQFISQNVTLRTALFSTFEIIRCTSAISRKPARRLI